MVRLYLDIETYRPNKAEAFVNERIISSGLLIDETPYNEDSLKEDIKPVLTSEWDGFSEFEIVKNVQDQVKEVRKNYEFVVLCGFNILRFDIPLLTCKCVHYLLDKHEATAKMWNNCFTIDYFQQLLIANRNYFKGFSLERIVEVSKSLGLKPPAYSTSGGAIKDLYDRGRYKEIEEHLKQDLLIVRWLDLCGAKKLIEKSVKEQKALFQEELRGF
jgi:hypothetical protein